MLNVMRRERTGLETGATKKTGATKAVCIVASCAMGFAAMFVGGCTGKTCSAYDVPAEKAAIADAKNEGGTTTAEAGIVYVVMHTTAGDIRLELDRLRAPIGVENFLKYARSGAYNGTIFHRVVPGFVVQGGGYKRDLVEITGDPKIKNEWENGLKNVRGTIAWARDEAADTATREFYFNLVDNAKLDVARPDRGGAGYAVFGKVVEGMNVIDEMERKAKEPGGRRKVNEDLQDVPTEIVEVTGVEVCGK